MLDLTKPIHELLQQLLGGIVPTPEEEKALLDRLRRIEQDASISPETHLAAIIWRAAIEARLTNVA